MAENARRRAVRREVAAVIGVVLAAATLVADLGLMPDEEVTTSPAKELVRLERPTPP